MAINSSLSLADSEKAGKLIIYNDCMLALLALVAKQVFRFEYFQAAIATIMLTEILFIPIGL